MTGKQMFVRTSLTVGLPLILLWAFVAELWRGQRSAFRFAWLEVRCNLAVYREQMQRNDY